MNEKQGITFTKKQLIIGAVVIVLLIAVGVFIGIKVSGKDKTPAEPQAQAQTDTDTASKPALELDENAGEYTGEVPKSADSSEAVGIKIPGYPSITIAKDTEDVTMALLNPEGNPCYFKFEIALKDKDETIFESKYVKPGDCIYDVHLTKPLAEGEYPAVIKITTIALDGETPLNGANVETLLIAK